MHQQPGETRRTMWSIAARGRRGMVCIGRRRRGRAGQPIGGVGWRRPVARRRPITPYAYHRSPRCVARLNAMMTEVAVQ